MLPDLWAIICLKNHSRAESAMSDTKHMQSSFKLLFKKTLINTNVFLLYSKHRVIFCLLINTRQGYINQTEQHWTNWRCSGKETWCNIWSALTHSNTHKRSFVQTANLLSDSRPCEMMSTESKKIMLCLITCICAFEPNNASYVVKSSRTPLFVQFFFQFLLKLKQFMSSDQHQMGQRSTVQAAKTEKLCKFHIKLRNFLFFVQFLPTNLPLAVQRQCRKAKLC